MANSLNSTSDWIELLTQFSREILADPAFTDGNLSQFVSDEQKASGWLGFPGATEGTLQKLEMRLGGILPPSYRSFLAASNGFGPIDPFIWQLWPSNRVDWLINTDKELVEIWEKGTVAESPVSDEEYFRPENMQSAAYMRVEYLRGCLMISDWGDAGFLALNPAVQHDGEWEAWHFANWHPGAVRYQSFAKLMQQTLESYRVLKEG